MLLFQWSLQLLGQIDPCALNMYGNLAAFCSYPHACTLFYAYNLKYAPTLPTTETNFARNKVINIYSCKPKLEFWVLFSIY